MSIKYSCISLRGNVREENQDNYLCAGFSGDTCLPVTAGDDEKYVSGCCEKGVFAVFDGIGGGCGGRAASGICAEYLGENCERIIGAPSEIIDVLEEMNDRVCSYGAENKFSVCGTTAAVVIAADNTVYCSNLGDSRIYYYSKGLNQISEEHVAFYKGRRALTRFVGIPDKEMVVEPSFGTVSCAAGSRVLICSDGLTDMVEEGKIAELIAVGGEVSEVCRNLAETALSNGGRDNITIILLEWGA